MDTKYVLLGIILITAVVSLLVIFMGCNDIDYSIPLECSTQYGTAQEINTCIQKHENRESACTGTFWWLRL